MQDTVFSVIAPLQSPEAQLEAAVSSGNMAEVQRVCAENRGLDPGTTKTKEGLSMLAVAAAAGKIDAFNQLRNTYHFDVHAVDARGETMLHHAARGGNLDLVKLLVEEGLLASHKNSQGRTPYDVASGKVGHIRQFLLPHVFAGEKKDGSAPKLPHWLEETKSRGPPGAMPEYTGPPPPTSAPRRNNEASRNSADQPYQLPNLYDGFGTSEVRQLGRGGPRMPTGPPPPNYTGGPGQAGAASGPPVSLHTQVGTGPSPHMRRAYVPYNSTTGVGQAYTAGRPTMGQPPPGGAHGASMAQNSRPAAYGGMAQGGAQGGGGMQPKLFVPTLGQARAPQRQGGDFQQPQQQQQQPQQQQPQQQQPQQQQYATGGFQSPLQQPNFVQRVPQASPYAAQGPAYR